MAQPAKIVPAPRHRPYLGLGFFGHQGILLGIAAAVSVLFWLFGGTPSIVPTVIFTFVVGNIVGVVLQLMLPLLTRFDGLAGWALYLGVLVPVGAFGSSLASLALLAMHVYTGPDRHHFIVQNTRFGTLITLLNGVAIYAVMSTRDRLERQNLLLQNQVELGALQLNAQQADLKTAHEIQSHLLPSEMPSMPGMQIACAWQPAQSVGGDYFDAFALDDRRIALAMGDVSGKGISAALLMANLQAAFRAFAPQANGPGALCERLNQALCANIAPAKFITFFYGELDTISRMLRYENAGHSAPILLRDGIATPLEGGGLVLGLFASAAYEDRAIHLRSGDCLLLTTDGVTEAADSHEIEFGEERLVASALAASSGGAHAIRTRILEDVTRHCNGLFQDDASLMVLTVD
jgi:sigma-B regulation protein RsbU (phosphoserine phosphatase)